MSPLSSKFTHRVARGLPGPLKFLIKLFMGKYSLVEGPLMYNQDGLATRHNSDFMTEPRFQRAYEAGLATGSWGADQIHWRVRVACWAAQKGMGIAGDFVECGVNRGGISRAVMEYLDFRNCDRQFYLLDTFCGLRDEYITEEEKKRGFTAGGYDECYDEVCRTFSSFPNARIIRGPVPDTLPQVKAEKVAYLSIDMNCVLPEIAAAEYFWDKLSSGAVIVLDDYNHVGYAVQKRGFDEFAAARGVEVLPLPTCQGLIIKP